MEAEDIRRGCDGLGENGVFFEGREEKGLTAVQRIGAAEEEEEEGFKRKSFCITGCCCCGHFNGGETLLAERKTFLAERETEGGRENGRSRMGFLLMETEKQYEKGKKG